MVADEGSFRDPCSGKMSIIRIGPNSGRMRRRRMQLQACRVVASTSWFGSQVFPA
jgi:hypothetical protein